MARLAQKILLPLLASVILLLMVAWMAGVFSDRVAPGRDTTPQALLADVISIVHSEQVIIEAVPASIEAKQATIISSRIMARISAVHVRAGDAVSRGEVLVELEQRDLQARTRQAAQKVRAVSARLKEARQSLARVDELYQKKLVALSEVDGARANFEALTAELAVARQLDEEASAALAFSVIRAPIDGRVVDRFAEPGDTAAPGQKLLSLYNPLSLRVEAQVREALALSLQAGQALTVEVPSLDHAMDAVIEERVPAADPGSRSFLVKARLPFSKDLLPGMYARMLVPAGSEQRILVPADRVVQLGQLNLVWVFEDGRANRRFVRIGNPVASGQIEILAGLSGGDSLLPVPPDVRK